MVKFFFHFYGMKTFQVELLKELKDSFECFLWVKEKIFCTVKKTWKLFVYKKD